MGAIIDPACALLSTPKLIGEAGTLDDLMQVFCKLGIDDVKETDDIGVPWIWSAVCAVTNPDGPFDPGTGVMSERG